MVEVKKPEVPQEIRLITILGPTATGKTSRAVQLAFELNAEIISADSRQVYRGMDIGTGKDLVEYQNIPYHLIDICEAGEKYNLHKYIKDFHKALKDIKSGGKNVILCGGTGMYLETALSGVILPDVPMNESLREELEKLPLEKLTEILKTYKNLHNTTDVDTVKRAVRAIEIEEYYQKHPEEAHFADRKKASPIDSLIIGIDIPRDVRRKRISRRLHARLEEGMVDEVKNLLDNGIAAEDLIYYGLEYKYLTLHVIGKLTYDEMVRQLEIAIHQFAKRQMTWFRGMERRGFKIHWLPYNLSNEEFIDRVKSLL
ncbi:MAG: tRNA (adenosine(37)-N6)-dimethylallyltransferase MiaA [Muribaculaceae bacterium]|nr:tRNA (adenosine(37)-N6)-dimethylallyltransferase MiaA [Muribaculaceae bacterium]